MQTTPDETQIKVKKINDALESYRAKIKGIEQFIQKKKDTNNLSSVREEIKKISKKQ